MVSNEYTFQVTTADVNANPFEENRANTPNRHLWNSYAKVSDSSAILCTSFSDAGHGGHKYCFQLDLNTLYFTQLPGFVVSRSARR